MLSRSHLSKLAISWLICQPISKPTMEYTMGEICDVPIGFDRERMLPIANKDDIN